MDSPSARVRAEKALLRSHLRTGTSAWEQENREKAGRQDRTDHSDFPFPFAPHRPLTLVHLVKVSENGRLTEPWKKSGYGHFITNPNRNAELAVQMHPKALYVSS